MKRAEKKHSSVLNLSFKIVRDVLGKNNNSKLSKKYFIFDNGYNSICTAAN